MSCRICREPAEDVAPAGDYLEWNCQTCKRYRISQTLLAEMEAMGLRLDVDQTRLWIATNSVAGVPVLSSFAARQNHLLIS